MGLIRRIGEERDRHIAEFAEPYLEDGEEILHWVRIRDPRGDRNGVAYLTPHRVVVHWTGRSDGHTAPTWTEVRSWGISNERRGGPVLCVKTSEGETYAQLRAATSGMASSATRFLSSFNELAPRPREPIRGTKDLGSFEAPARPSVSKEKGSVGGLTKRFVVTVLGIALIVGGIIITPIPGPWSAPIILGGLALLAKEYDWADDLLTWGKKKMKATAEKITSRKAQG